LRVHTHGGLLVVYHEGPRDDCGWRSDKGLGFSDATAIGPGRWLFLFVTSNCPLSRFQFFLSFRVFFFFFFGWCLAVGGHDGPRGSAGFPTAIAPYEPPGEFDSGGGGGGGRGGRASKGRGGCAATPEPEGLNA